MFVVGPPVSSTRRRLFSFLKLANRGIQVTEAERILKWAKGDAGRAFDMVEQQLSVLVMRAQVMLSLSGIVITVTGFSGRAIAQSGRLAQVLVAAGIIVVLLSAAIAIGGVLRLRWLTQELSDDVLDTLGRMLRIRDEKSKSLSFALVLFVLGFACYCVAIAQMLLTATS